MLINKHLLVKNIDISSFQRLNSAFRLLVKREDTIGDGISGNKFRKLKYNLEEVGRLGLNRVVTFGGAYSNHIYAASFIKKKFGIDVIGIVRGEELRDKILENPTLKLAQENGMQFHFVSREDYRKKNTSEFVDQLKVKFGDFYLLPEGGTNDLAIKGCEEILTREDKAFDYVCCAVGTGGTIAGIINSSSDEQKVLGFSALKGDFLKKDIAEMTKRDNWELITDYHFGGYAKASAELIHFMNDFKKETGVLLDSIYNGKMLFGIYDLMKKGYFNRNTSILAIHTGGTQSIAV